MKVPIVWSLAPYDCWPACELVRPLWLPPPDGRLTFVSPWSEYFGIVVVVVVVVVVVAFAAAAVSVLAVGESVAARSIVVRSGDDEVLWLAEVDADDDAKTLSRDDADALADSLS